MPSTRDKASSDQTAAITCQVIKNLLDNDDFKSQVENIVTNAVEKKLEELVTKVDKLQKGLDQKQNEMLSIIERVEGNMFDLHNKFEKNMKEVDRLEALVAHQEQQITVLKNSCNAMEQYSRRTSIRIFGIKESKGEDTAIVADIVTKKLGVKLDIRDIDRSHRTGKVPEKLKTAAAAVAADPNLRLKPRSILVKLTSYMYRKRREILANRRKLKGQGIVIVEDLTVRNQKLLAAVRKVDKSKIVDSWSTDGRIIALLPGSGGKGVTRLIAHEDDLKNI